MGSGPHSPLGILELFAGYVRDAGPGHGLGLQTALDDVPRVNAFDPTGKLACIYAKRAFAASLAGVRVPLLDVVSDPGRFAAASGMWEAFHSEAMAAIEDELAQLAASLVNAASATPLVGDASQLVDELAEAVGAAARGLGALSEHVWLASGEQVSRPASLPVEVARFDSAAACLAALDAGPDGMTLAYVRPRGAEAGFFGVFLKSNGNIVSYDDMVMEAYPGQNDALGGRNARYLGARAHGLFPYAGVEGAGAHDGPVRVLSLGEDAYLPLMLAMSCVANRLDGRAFDPASTSNMHVSSLAAGTPAALALGASDALCAIGDPAAALDFDGADVVSGARFKRYGKVTCEAPSDVDALVAAHAAGVEVDLGAAAAPPAREFVQSVEGARAWAYASARGQVAEAVLADLVREVDAIGGAEGAQAWLEQAVRDHEGHVREFCARCYAENPEHNRDIVSGYRTDDAYGARSVHHDARPYFRDQSRTPLDEVRVEAVGRRGSRRAFLYDEAGTRESLVFAFSPTSALDIARFLGVEVDELPPAVREWSRSGDMAGYNGNRLLDLVDPVGELKHPLAGYGRDMASNGERDRAAACSFEVQVGFTRRALNSILRRIGAEPVR